MSIWKYFSVRWIFWLFRFAVEYTVFVVGVWMSRFVETLEKFGKQIEL